MSDWQKVLAAKRGAEAKYPLAHGDTSSEERDMEIFTAMVNAVMGKWSPAPAADSAGSSSSGSTADGATTTGPIGGYVVSGLTVSGSDWLSGGTSGATGSNG